MTASTPPAAGATARPARPARPSASATLVAAVFLVIGASALLAASLVPVAAVAAAASSAATNLLDFPPLVDDLGEPWERSVVTDREGNNLAVIREENRATADLADVPAHVQNAVLATEDAEFREHEGVNWQAVGRAAFSNVRAGEITAGGSTITQQLVKNVALSGEQTVDRKLQEAVYAIELESRLTKDEILEAYLNEAYFGNRVYGIATAAEFYFDSDVSDLTIEEAALLAGVIRAPTTNDPIGHPEPATARRNVVLTQMAQHGWLDRDEAEVLASEPLELDVQPLPEPAQPFFVDYVQELLLDEAALGEDEDERRANLRKAGLEIRTTLHPELQTIAEDAIRSQLDGDDDPDAVLTTIDPANGEVLALGLGPREYGDEEGQTQVNPATARMGGSGRQSGSSFKAFMLAAALEQGMSPGYTFEGGEEYEFENLECTPSDYAPGNFEGADHDALDMIEATEISSNVYFAHLLDEHGPEPLVDVTERLGVPLPRAEQIVDGPECAVVLGTEDVFPLDMTSAFAAFANSGDRCEPHAIIEVRDRHGDVLTSFDEDCEQVIAPETADWTTELLRGVVEDGTASEHGQIGRPAAGKTGTTTGHVDAWFAGYVPQLATTAWVGHEQPQEMTHEACDGGVTGGCLPTMIWQEYMSEALDVLDLDAQDFPEPPSIPQTEVPDVVGDDADDATDDLTDADLTSSTSSTEHWAPEGMVVSQDPEEGIRVNEGTMVELDVSDGTEDAPTMPDLVGEHVSDAEETLSEIDVEPIIQTVPVTDASSDDVVIDQGLEPGSPLYSGMNQVPVLLMVGELEVERDPIPETATPDTDEDP